MVLETDAADVALATYENTIYKPRERVAPDLSEMKGMDTGESSNRLLWLLIVLSPMIALLLWIFYNLHVYFKSHGIG